MDFDFSEDQNLLREQVRKFLTDKCPMATTRRVLDGSEPYAKEVWKGLVDMGLTGTAIPEEFGGLGLGPLELCVIAEELGRAVAPVPFSSSIYLAAEGIKLFGTTEQKIKWLPSLASGELIGTFAFAEGTIAPSQANISTQFRQGKISGEKLPVPDGDIADVAVVVVAVEGNPDGVSLAICDLREAGVTREVLSTIDPTRSHARLSFKNAPAELMGKQTGWADLERILDGAAVLFAFEQVGGSEAALELARQYTMQRYAFGRVIGSYQAIKHRLADMYVKKELARSNAYYGAMMLANDAADLAEAAAAARIAGCEAYTFAAQEGLHAHGGIGYTWEANTQFHYRRARLLALALGGPLQWKEKLVNRLLARNAA